MDRNTWLQIIAIKKLVVDACGAIEDDPKAIATVICNLNKATCILHDMETEFIQRNNVGTLEAGV